MKNKTKKYHSVGTAPKSKTVAYIYMTAYDFHCLKQSFQ